MRPPAILTLGACVGADVDIFFPPGETANAYGQARQYCYRCPVTAECLQYALDTNTAHGMFGGATPQEREDIRSGVRDRREFEQGHGDKAGTEAGYYRERRAGMPTCEACTAAVTAAAKRRAKARKVAIA